MNRRRAGRGGVCARVSVQMGFRFFRSFLPFALAVARAFLSAQEPQPLAGDCSPSKYVGAEVCQGCHEDQYKAFAASAHAQTLKRPRLAEQGCEACHGPGAEHVPAGDPDKIRRFPSATPATILQVCGSCHEVHMNDVHSKAHLTCLTCHSAHHYVQRASILVAPSVELCKRCHR